MDRLTSMAVFVRVVEKGSFVAAADEMAISPRWSASIFAIWNSG